MISFFNTSDDFFDDFQKIFEQFPKISEDSPKVKLSEGQTIVSEHFLKISDISDDFQGRTDGVLIIQEHI